VTPVHTEPFVTILYVGDDELLNGLFPAAGYGFILSPSTLSDTGLSVTRTFNFFSFLSLALLSDALNIYTRGVSSGFFGQRATTISLDFLAGHTYKKHKTLYM
jgi:hypothetical protein